MSLLFYPDVRLELISVEIERDDFSPKLIDELTSVMYEQSGVGLAAPQINVQKRIFITDCTGGEKSGNLKVFINPTVIFREGTQVNVEGCLSLPGVQERVVRSLTIDVKYRDENWNEQMQRFQGFEAQIIQHEQDHLDGKLFLDRISAAKRNYLKKQYVAPRGTRR